MENIKLQEVINNYKAEKSEIEKKEAVIELINSKLQTINETQTKIQNWSKSIADIKNPIDKATLIQAKFDSESEIEKQESEIESLWQSINDEFVAETDHVPDEIVSNDENEKVKHSDWLLTNILKYAGFAFGSLLLFIFIHGSQFLKSHEWADLLNTLQYTHQIFLKISMGFFGILALGISVNLLIPSVLRYFNSKINHYDFMQDFLESDAKTRLYVMCILLYCLMQYWGNLMSWQIVL